MNFFCATLKDCNFEFVELCVKFNARDFSHYNFLRGFRDIFFARQFLILITMKTPCQKRL